MELHERCLRCGRVLKNEKYKILGYGPVCWEKTNKLPKTYTLFDFDDSTIDSPLARKGAGQDSKDN